MKKVIITAVVILVVLICGIFYISNRQEKNEQWKVGVILNGTKDDQNWTQSHYEGLEETAKELNLEMIYHESVPETEECFKLMEEMVSSGCKIIICNSFNYGKYALEMAEKYPEISFFHASGVEEAANLSTYFGRMYQARYLTGIIAGLKTETNSIGYVAAMPNSEVNRGINAFTLGVKSVNPEATVYVSWTDSWNSGEKETAAAKALINDKNADLITYHQNQHYSAIAADDAGVYSIGYNAAFEGLSEKYLTAAVWNWDSLYFQIIREFVQGQPNTVEHRWFDINSGAVELSEMSPLITEEIKNVVEAEKIRLCTTEDVFSGVIYDNEGGLRCSEGETLSDGTLLTGMDWYVDGVEIYNG